LTTEENKQVLRRFTDEFINTGAPSLAEEFVSPDAVFHAPTSPEPLRGPAGYLQLLGMLRGAFPDVRWTLEEMVAEGDKVAARFTMRGTHQGAFLGLPPSGRAFAATSMAFYRFENGKIVEENGMPDMASIMQQIGPASH
jgi:steroid delta-isomerase-like uncharacterized protein